MLMVLSTIATANQYPGQNYWYNPAPGQWNYPAAKQRQPAPTTGGQRSNNPYGNAWPSQQRPGYPASNYYGNQTTKPFIETKISSENPYVQQNVILKLSVVSQNNLVTVLPQLPQIGSFLLNLQEGPVTYSRTIKGKRQIVNDFYYQVTPLKPGQFEIPAISVTGEEQMVGYQRGNSAFKASMSSAIKLNVREANPSSKPWLPVEQLNLKVKLPEKFKAAAGKPLPFTTEISALGISGSKLPSLENQLSSDAFRVYRDRNQTHTYLDKKSNRIVGRRVETFTLVPQFGGDLKLPQLSINWWNTRSDMAQRASVPIQPIAVSGNRKESGFFEAESSLFPSGTSAAFWVPLGLVFGVIFGYWMALWLSHRKAGGKQNSPLEPLIVFFRNPMQRLAPAFSPLKDKLRSTTAILNPVTRWHRWRRRLVGALPLSVRFYYCVRFVDEESDPELWGYTLRFLANKHLSLPTNAPYSVIADHILDFHPKAEPLKIRQLIHQLEEAIYGHSDLDFDLWKEAFKHEIRPSLKIWRMDRKDQPKQKEQNNILPNLNPEAVSGQTTS
ncbi:MAG: BatD family protein [Candidatus Thiodiazotropha taylori]|nr:BatD family protein [Candidatus Thiodiazotropha taylori]MCG8052701.1 BatD family protein [Candidatus Thiodiazotropha taylori]MCG8055590.1 BatD family protein [Candidatus Thiodiazotropha taylori]MCW4314522.1 BatD family protein [Candidatus Thiodiazotropha taylori]MCW4317418.1 BatD family protein [Candidatus Thiodiazotropha taylori]